MAVIKDYMDGPCRIIVHDDSIRPPEEVKKIVERVSQMIINEEIRKAMAKKTAGKDKPGIA